MPSSIIGALRVTLGLDTAAFTTGSRKAKAEASDLAKAIQKSTRMIQASVAGVFAGMSLNFFAGMVKDALEYASSLDEVSQQLGVTSRDLQVFRYAGSQVGISVETMDKALGKFTKALGEARTGSADAAKVFKALGFSDSDIKHLDVHAALLKTADGISQVGDRAARAVPETKLFGKAGQDLDTLLAGGAKSIEEFAAQADKLGLIIPEQFIQRADAAADKMAELDQVLKMRMAGAIAENADAIKGLADELERAALAAVHYISSVRGAFKIKANEGWGAALQASGADNVEAGSSTGYMNRVKRQYQDVRGRYDRTYAAAHDPKNPRRDLDAATLVDVGKEYRGTLTRYGAAIKDVQKENAEAKAARMMATTAKGGDRSLDGLGATEKKGKSADQLAKEAEAARIREVERQKQVAAESARLDDEYLSARQSMTQDTFEQAALARERLDADTRAKLAAVDDDVSAGRVKVAEADGLRERIRRNDAIEADAINQRENADNSRQANAVADAHLDSLRDQLGLQSELATTNAERRRIAVELLAAEKEAERRQLQQIADDANRPLGQRQYDQGTIDQANDRLGNLDTIYAGKTAQANKANQGQFGSYVSQLHSDTDDMNDALGGVATHGLQSIQDGLSGLVTGTESVGEAFHKMAADTIADTHRIIIEVKS